MTNFIENFWGKLKTSLCEPEPKFLKLLNWEERNFVLSIFQKMQKTFPSYDVLILGVGGTLTRTHNKSIEERDVDIIVNFSSPTGSEERLGVIRSAEKLIKEFLRERDVSYVQHSGLLEGAGIDGVNGFKGWTLVAVELEGQKELVTALLDNFPQLRFVTKKTSKLRSFDIMLWGISQPSMEGQLKLEEKSGLAYEVLYDSRIKNLNFF